jgi:hypothetical protein
MAPAERQFSNLAATPDRRLSVPSFVAVLTLFANPNVLRARTIDRNVSVPCEQPNHVRALNADGKVHVEPRIFDKSLTDALADRPCLIFKRIPLRSTQNFSRWRKSRRNFCLELGESPLHKRQRFLALIQASEES